MRRLVKCVAVASCILLASCGTDKSPSAPSTEWQVNDWDSIKIGGARIRGNVLTIPSPPQSANYITRSSWPLTLNDTMRITFTLDAPVKAKEDPAAPALATLYFQRRGDNWSATGKYETYRWYASFATVRLTGSGTYVMEAPLSARWTAVQGSNSIDQAAAFKEALADADKVGFVLGGGGGLGHGVTGPATLTITSFTITAKPRLPG